MNILTRREQYTEKQPVRGELTVTQRLRSEALLDRAFSGKTSGLQHGGALSPC